MTVFGPFILNILKRSFFELVSHNRLALELTVIQAPPIVREHTDAKMTPFNNWQNLHSFQIVKKFNKVIFFGRS